MTTQHTDEMREAFEKWYGSLSQYLSEPWTRKMAAQDAWQAATAAADAKYREVIEKLEKHLATYVDELNSGVLPLQIWMMLKVLNEHRATIAAPLLGRK